MPGNRVRPVRSSAMMQPTDQMSTATHHKDKHNHLYHQQHSRHLLYLLHTRSAQSINNSELARQLKSCITHYCRFRWCNKYTFKKPETCHVVVHPVEHDLRRAIPSRGHIARHLIVRMSRQAKVQDLSTKCKGSESAIKRAWTYQRI